MVKLCVQNGRTEEKLKWKDTWCFFSKDNGVLFELCCGVMTSMESIKA